MQKTQRTVKSEVRFENKIEIHCAGFFVSEETKTWNQKYCVGVLC